MSLMIGDLLDIGVDMDSLETGVNSFVIKIWLEDSADESGHPVWRGRITHVASGQHRFIVHLDEINSFIWPYLEKMGVRPKFYRRLVRWLQDRRLSFE